MPDFERLKRAWKLHERAQSDNGQEAATAATLRDKILTEEKVTLEQLEVRFGAAETVPPFGRPAGQADPMGGFGFGFNSTNTFGSGFGFAGSVDPDLKQRMQQAAEQMRRKQEEMRRERVRAKRVRYRDIPPDLHPVIENLIRQNKQSGADLKKLLELLQIASDVGTCQNQLEALANKIDEGEATSKAALQQAMRTLVRNGRKQNEALSRLLSLMVLYVGSHQMQHDAQGFSAHFGEWSE